jgi:type III secretion system FlhB-like substrate exporter
LNYLRAANLLKKILEEGERYDANLRYDSLIILKNLRLFDKIPIELDDSVRE